MKAINACDAGKKTCKHNLLMIRHARQKSLVHVIRYTIWTITRYESHVLLALVSSMHMQKSVCRQAMVCPSPQRPTGSGTIRNIAPGRHAELTKSSRHAPQLVSDLSTRTSSLQKQSSIDGRTVAAVNRQHPKARQDRRTQICCLVRNKSKPARVCVKF